MNKRTVYIENVPVFKDLVKLQKAIDGISAERLQHKRTDEIRID